MARHQVHRCRWLACRRRSAAPPITISRLSRGKTVEKCTGSRPARKSKSPERIHWALDTYRCFLCARLGPYAHLPPLMRTSKSTLDLEVNHAVACVRIA